MGNVEFANGLLLEAVQTNPWNWAAWDTMVVQSSKSLDLMLSKSAECLFKRFFHLKALLWLQSDATAVIRSLLQDFPHVGYLNFAVARNAYNCREFERAIDMFSKLSKQYEDRLDFAHVYSDALFILGRKTELSALTAQCVKINRFCPETCCVLGNLWSLQGEHEKAVISFRRALRLDTEMQSAWVLVGHEFIELRNPSAAISCYLRATSISYFRI